MTGVQTCALPISFNALYITKLSTRIGEMIKDGYEIEKVMEQKIGMDGGIVRYMRYYKKAV